MSAEAAEYQSTEVEAWSRESMSEARISSLIRSVKPSSEVIGDRKFGVHVLDGADVVADIARYIEVSVFDEHFGNDLDVMKHEYGTYDTKSTFLTVIDYEKDMPVGAIRIIRPSELGLKSMHDLVDAAVSPWYRPGDTEESRFDEIGLNPSNTVDIATMAIMPGYRTKHAVAGASAALYSSCVRWSLANEYNQWITIVDKNIYDMMQSWGEPFVPFKGASFASYLDSKASLPVHTELHTGLKKIKQFDETMSKKHDTLFNVCGLYTQGIGLHDNFVLPSFSDIVQ